MKKVLFLLIVIVVTLLFWQLFIRDLNLKGSAKLSWNPGSEKDIAVYKIYYGTSKRIASCPPGGYENKIKAGKENSYLIDDLENGKTYYFSVTSLNEAGKESCFSEEMSKTIRITFWDKIKTIFK